MIVLIVIGHVLLAYAAGCALWFSGVMLLDRFYFKSSRHPNGDVGLAVLALSLIPLAPVAWLADRAAALVDKVRQ